MSETRPNPKQSAITGCCLPSLAGSLALLLCSNSRTRTLSLLMLLHPLATRCICCSLHLQLPQPPPPYSTHFCQKFLSILIIDFRSLPSLTLSFPTADHWLHATVNVATLALQTPQPTSLLPLAPSGSTSIIGQSS